MFDFGVWNRFVLEKEKLVVDFWREVADWKSDMPGRGMLRMLREMIRDLA